MVWVSVRGSNGLLWIIDGSDAERLGHGACSWKRYIGCWGPYTAGCGAAYPGYCPHSGEDTKPGEHSWAAWELEYTTGPEKSQLGSLMKDRSKPGGNRGTSGSEMVFRVCVLWLSWLRTGDKPESTDPWGTFSQDEASRACKSWAVTGWPWLDQSLPGACIIVL